jgi:hypothetical protein
MDAKATYLFPVYEYSTRVARVAPVQAASGAVVTVTPCADLPKGKVSQTTHQIGGNFVRGPFPANGPAPTMNWTDVTVFTYGVGFGRSSPSTVHLRSPEPTPPFSLLSGTGRCYQSRFCSARVQMSSGWLSLGRTCPRDDAQRLDKPGEIYPAGGRNLSR